MKLRWSFRAANDRGPQAESQVPSLAPDQIERSGFLFHFYFYYSADKTAMLFFIQINLKGREAELLTLGPDLFVMLKYYFIL